MANGMSYNWLKEGEIRDQNSNAVTWTLSGSGTRVSTVEDLFYGTELSPETDNSLQSILRLLEHLELRKIPADDVKEIKFLGRGETFQVYECAVNSAVVAVKRLQIHDTRDGSNPEHFPRRLQAVVREIIIMSHAPVAQHPNVVSLQGYGWGTDLLRVSPFIALEFAEYGTLRAFLKSAKQLTPTKLGLMGDVALGVAALHESGIVHGDLKLDNVLVFPDQERPSTVLAKVSDFGHSVLVGSGAPRSLVYIGTEIYNAPEVAHQKSAPILPHNLHKCDVWSFGLSIWETLDDGRVYFRRVWRNNETYSEAPFPTPSPMAEAPLGEFDPAHLKGLAADLVSSINPREMGFGSVGPAMRKAVLRLVLSRTLEPDPDKRLSDLATLPFVRQRYHTRKGTAGVPQVASDMLFPETGYSLFDRDSPIVADWPQQQQLLRDIESLTLSKAAWQQEDEGTAAFHTMLCYTNSLGTSRDYVKAAEFLQLAQREGHPIARILGSRLIDAFSGTPSGHSESYWQCLTAGFVLAEKSDTPPVTDAADPCLRDFSDYRRLREYCLCRILPNVAPNGIVPQHPVVLGDEERDFLGHAIQNGDPELVARILQAGGPPGYAMSSRVQIACIHAARLGQVVVLEKILQSVYPDVQRVSYVLHWLFSVPGAKMDAIASTLTRSIGEESDAVNYAKSWGVQLHTQWPFRIREIPLTTAIASGSLQAVRTLLKLGADPLISITRTINTKRPPRWTPIHLAVRYHQPDILIALLEKPIRNEDPRVDIQRGLTPWPFACALSGTSIAERLAIHGSAYLANLKRTIALFSGEALSHRSADGTTALSQAIDHEDVDVVRQLLEYHPRLAWGKLWVPRKSSYTYPLHVACQMGSNRDTKEALEIVSIIVGHNPDGVSQQDSSGYHPLHLAAMGISTQIMELLIRHGASIHAEDKAGRTPLFLCRDAPCVNLLVNSGADVNHADDQDICPLQEVSSQGAEGAVQELILAGAKLDVGKNKAGTPLHFAVRRGAFETIQHLLTAGAETDPFDAEHRTPLSLAMDTKRADVVSVLLRNRANAFFWDCGGITPFHKLLRTDNPNFLREFQKHRCSVSVPRVMETSILQFALGRRDEGATRIAMDFMGLPCYVTQDGSAGNATGGTTSLEKAAMAFRHDIVDALLSNNPAIYGRDSQLKAAIQLVCSAGKQRDPQVEDARLQTMERLLNAGVTIIKAGESGSTVGHIALREDDPGLMMVFARHWERSTKSSKADPPSEPQWYKRFTEFFLGRTEAPSVPARGPHQQRDIVLHILPVEGRLG